MTNFAEMISDFQTRIANLDRIVNPGCSIIESHGWIVCYPNSTTSYAFDVVDQKATNPRVQACEKVNRFTREDAERVAASCTDKNGSPLVARHYRDVCAEELPIIRDLVSKIQEVA